MTSTTNKKEARVLMEEQGIPYTQALAKVQAKSLGIPLNLPDSVILDYAKGFDGFKRWLTFGLTGPSGFTATLRSVDGLKACGMTLVTDENNDWTREKADIKEDLKELGDSGSPKVSRMRAELELDLADVEKLEREALKEYSVDAPWYPSADDVINGVSPEPEFDGYLPRDLTGLSHLVFYKDWFDASTEIGWGHFVSSALEVLGGSVNPDVVSMRRGKVTGIEGDDVIYVRVTSLEEAHEVMSKLATFMGV